MAVSAGVRLVSLEARRSWNPKGLALCADEEASRARFGTRLCLFERIVSSSLKQIINIVNYVYIPRV